MSGTPPIPTASTPPARLPPGFFGAWRGAWLLTWKAHLTWRRLPLRLAALLVLPALVFITTRSPHSQSRLEANAHTFYRWLVEFYIYIIVPLVCVRGCGALIRDELQADTLGFLITRPISRARLLLVKYLSQAVWLEILLLAETLLIFAVGAARQIPALGVLLPLVLAVQFLAIPAWGALGVLLGQMTTRYMAAALLYGGVVEMGIGRIPTNINTLSLLRHIKTLLSQNAALQGLFNWPDGRVATAILALAAAPVLFMAVSALLFTYVKCHHATEMQK